MSSPAPSGSSRPLLLFLASATWVAVCLTAGRVASSPVPAAYADLVQQAVTAILLFGGSYLMARSSIGDLRPLSAVGYVQRPGVGGEFLRGLALGWAVTLCLLLPALLSGNFHASFAFDSASALLTVRSALVLLLFAVNVQLIVSGLPARVLLRTTGPGWTAAATIFASAFTVFLGQAQPGRNLLFAGLSAAVFSSGFLRTRAAWLPLGVQVGWTISLQLLFGCTSPYTPPSTSVVAGAVGGSPALTGGAFGPESSLWAIAVMLLALVALYRLTRDYAWHYTYQPITGAGYPMDVPPPAEHQREANRAAAAAPLVQIGGVAVPPPSPGSTESGQ